MSPKQSSLALADECQALDVEDNYMPQLNLVEIARYSRNSTGATADEVVLVRGRMTVSF